MQREFVAGVVAGVTIIMVCVYLFCRRLLARAESAVLAPKQTTNSAPMMANQEKLPRWPLPSLDDTLARYLELAKTVAADDRAFAATKVLVKESLAPGSQMRTSQARLVAYDEAKTSPSFITDFWEGKYLEGDEGIAVHSSVGVGLKTTCFEATATSQVQRAARMLAATAAFAVEVESGTLPAPTKRGTQYSRMFASCRVPNEGRDTQYKAAAGTVSHIVVLRASELWRVQIVDTATAAPLSVPMLERQLQYIVDHSPRLAAPMDSPPPLSVLTTGDRAVWAAARRELAAASTENAASLRTIDDALLHVCLDLQAVRRDGEERVGGCPAPYEGRVRSYLHGHPRLAPRWFDKSAVLMFSADDESVPMALMEHSFYDGLPAFDWYREIIRRVHAADYAPSAMGCEAAPLPQRLALAPPPSVAAAARTAEAKLQALADSLSVACLRFTHFGASQLKDWGVSPDAVVQQGFQLAFHKRNGRQPFTYESCSMQHYAGGRTETLRPRTDASVAFVQSVASGAPKDEQAQRLRAAAKAHRDGVQGAKAGRGVDRHLLALRAVCELEPKLPLPPFFSDATYSAFSLFELSTSNLTDPDVVETPCAFGPTHPRGLGVCYNLAPGELAFTCTAYSPQDASDFSRELEAALLRIAKLLEAPAAPPPTDASLAGLGMSSLLKNFRDHNTARPEDVPSELAPPAPPELTP